MKQIFLSGCEAIKNVKVSGNIPVNADVLWDSVRYAQVNADNSYLVFTGDLITDETFEL